MDRSRRGGVEEGLVFMVSTFNSLDIGLGIFLVLGLVHGLWRGFVFQTIRLGGLVAGILLARAFNDPIAEQIRTRVVDVGGSMNHAVAYGLIVLTIVTVASLLSRFARGWVTKAELTGFDRIIGGGFGVVKSMIYSFLVLVLLQGWLIPDEATARAPEPGSTRNWFLEQFETSRVLPIYDRCGTVVKPGIPPRLLAKWNGLIAWVDAQGRLLGRRGIPASPLVEDPEGR